MRREESSLSRDVHWPYSVRMRHFCVLLCLILTLTAHAAEWRNDVNGCSANLPDTAGWLPIEAPNSPALTVLVAMQNPQKQAVFGINILHDLPNANLKDPATMAKIESNLRGLGYQFFGRATVNIGGREWVQFPVRGGTPPTSGLIRYTSANDRVYVVSLLRGGGQEAAQDTELLAAAASVQIGGVQVASATPPSVTTPAPTIPGATSSAPAPSVPQPATVADKTASDGKDEPIKIGPVTLTKEQLRLGIYGVAGLLVLMILLKIVGGGGDKQKR
jgi:hypothetical protein